jgi:hypothetical protein
MQKDANSSQKNFNSTKAGFNSNSGADGALKRKNSIGNLLKKSQDLFQSQEVV